MKKKIFLIIMCLSVFGLQAQNRPGEAEEEDPKATKANFRVQIFKKADTSDIILTKPDPEYRDRLPISAMFSDSARVRLEDMPKAARVDSIWSLELTNSDLFETMHRSVVDQEYSEVVLKELPTELLKERLEKLNARTPFNVEYHPVLESVIKTYLKRNKKDMERLMALSEYYFPMFEQELDRHDIPLEIKYLAIVESALNPRARSRMGATGLWQFMFTTGKMHGLDVSSYVDERMDPVMASEAASQYLARLYKSFGDWDLALAAYNSGPGNVSKAIRRSGGSVNYWELRRFLPRETAGYVPAFLATMYLFEYADEHDFQPQRPELAFFETDTIHPKEMITFDQVSKITGVEKELLQFLNPSYKLDIIPHIEDEAYALRLPRHVTGLFVNNEKEIYGYAKEDLAEKKDELPRYTEAEDRIRYRVKSGDYLGKIAAKYGVGVSSIKRWNNLRSNNVRIGQYLTIYPRTAQAVSNTNKKTSTNSQDSKVYTVKKGDSLWSISRKFPGVTVQNLRAWNNIGNTSLKPGMKIKVSKG